MKSWLPLFLGWMPAGARPEAAHARFSLLLTGAALPGPNPNCWTEGLFPTGIDRQRVEVQELREHKTAQTTMIYPDALNRVGRGTVPLHQLLKHVSDETQKIMRTHRTA